MKQGFNYQNIFFDREEFQPSFLVKEIVLDYASRDYAKLDLSRLKEQSISALDSIRSKNELSEFLAQQLVRLEMEPREFTASNVFYPSGITGCSRRLYYQWNGYKREDSVDVRSKMRMILGTIFHRYIQELIASNNPGTIVEYKVDNKKYGYRGYVDLLIKDETGYTPVELKTTSRYIRDPHPNHVIQAYLYYYDLQDWAKENNVNLNDPVIAYFDIGFSTPELFKEFSVVIDHSKYLDLLKCMEQIKDGGVVYNRINLITGEQISNGDRICRFCPYKEECWK